MPPHRRDLLADVSQAAEDPERTWIMTDTQIPEVTARVEENWAALEIDGETQTIRADSEEEVRYEILRRTVQIAADANTDVHLIATDRDGEWRLIVTPEGEVSETGAVSNAHGAHQGDDGTPDAAAADHVAVPSRAGADTAEITRDDDPRPYYDFSGPVDDALEQTTFRERGMGASEPDGNLTEPDGNADTVDEDPVNDDPVRGDAVGGAPVGGAPVGGDAVGGDAVDGAAMSSDPISSDPISVDTISMDAVGAGDVSTDSISTSDLSTDSISTSDLSTDTVRRDSFATAHVSSDGQKSGDGQEPTTRASSLIGDPPSAIADPPMASAPTPTPAHNEQSVPANQSAPARQSVPANQSAPENQSVAAGQNGPVDQSAPVDRVPDEPMGEPDAGQAATASAGEQIADAPVESQVSAPGPQAVGDQVVGNPQLSTVRDPHPSAPDSQQASAPSTPPAASAPGTSAQAPLPTLADFQAKQPPPVIGPASRGWRGVIRRATGGLISPEPSVAEQRHREAIASVTRSLSGPRTICVINPKGGAHKTTATMLIASTFGMYRGGYTLAWDNNETRGTLGWRAHQARHTNTAVNLLNDIDRFTDLRSARVGDLDNYVRSQAEAQFDVLASDEDAAASSMIDDEAFRRLHETLQRFYRIIVVDTGNNMRASNWEAAIAAADQLVIVSAIREDTAGGAAWMVEGLARKGHEDKLRDAVTILSAPDKNVDAKLRSRLFDHFGSLTRDVIEVPYDTALVSGGSISIDALAPVTREAWLTATATIANGL